MRTRSARTSPIDAASDLGPALGTLAQMSRTDPAVFAQFVLRDENTGLPIILAPVHEEWHDILTNHQRAVLWSATELGKAVPLDTPIPTPTGWTTMGDLKVGDLVFGRDGRPCRVTFATAVQHDRNVFRVVFDDGDAVMADADHRWIARRAQRRRVATADLVNRSSGDGSSCACGCGGVTSRGKRYIHNHHRRRDADEDGWETVTTSDMIAHGVKEGDRRQWMIPLAGPVAYPVVDLPIPAYVLGAWLGDGDSAAPILTFHRDDRFVFDRCLDLVGGGEAKGDPRSPDVMRGRLGTRGARNGCHGDPTCLRNKLHKLGVLGDKHIPGSYLRADIDQRRELLAGILDTDGSVTRCKNGGASFVELSLCNERLATDSLELIRSLGFKARMKASPAKIRGRVVGTRWRIVFTARTPVFRLPRKLARQNLTPTRTRSGRRYISAIERVASVPVRCITVDSPDHSYLMGRGYTVTHNTAQIAICRALYEIGKNPNIRILIISAASGQAKKIVKAIKGYIERSLEYRMAFPNVVPDKSETTGMWREDSFVVRRAIISKDPTVQAVGYGGNVLGARADLVIIDDYLTAENTYSDEQRKKFYGWLKSTIEGRKTSRGRLWFIGNAWHVDDAMHRYAAEEGTFSKKFPVRTPDGELAWAEMWPPERIAQEIENRGPIESRRSMFCDPVSDADRRFKLDYIQKALAKGDGLELAYALSVVPPGYRTITGVDLAFSKRSSADETALVTIAVDERAYPLGTGERQVLDVDGGKWSGPETVGKIYDIQHRYNSIVIVESNAAQITIKQFADERGAIPIKPFYTGRNKVDPAFGIQSLAIEMSSGKWVLPNHGGVARGIHARMHEQVRKLINEMMRYDPVSHTGDRLVAAWLAREGVRMTSSPPGVGKRPRRT